ncbi:3-hydroxyisobutyrate dehydrogenase [Rhizoctonia solani AG-1 IB]|uniref:3-hydroxyisobutyrate dehydrogenase n=1 Tax=Thanatephorus cucumeris (strain AG1-IB / isolate 7/3/14) TaxID=1108050 RepID=A0A0B7FAR6_THACB|nr:3-hydroxyisobutyrate dehydrogenase [Rhizoctonia solani AG-1 IB]
MRSTLRTFNAALNASHRSRKSLGFIGLGQMGLNMADNLFTRTATAYTEGSTANTSNPPVFVVCDVNKITADTFAQDIATRFPGVLVEVADSPSDVAQRANTIFTMLPSTPQVKEVYLGARGILEGVNKRPERVQSLYVDSTTLDVTAARDVAAQVEATGGDMVDAPVSGGVVGARAGTLSFMVGGSENGFKRSHPFLSHMGRNIVHCGPSGSGLTAKICNNLVLGVQQIVVAEAMLLGTRLGLSPEILAGVINTSTGRCWSSEVNNPVPGALPGKSPPCEREFHGGFASKLMQKDMLLAQHAAATAGTPLPLGNAAQSIYTQMNQDATDGAPKFADRDFSVVYEYLRRQATKTEL